MIQWEHLPDLDKTTYKPLYIQLSDLLADYIRSQGLSDGAPLPSENQLLSRYEVSRTTIRQAMQRLEAQELALKIRGKGTFVAKTKERKSVRGFQNLEDALASQGISVTNVLLDFDDALVPQPLCRDVQLPSGSTFKCIRRLKLANDHPLAIEERYLPQSISRSFTKENFLTQPVFDVLDAYPEFKILRVVYTITGSLLTDKEAKWLNADSMAPIIRRAGTYYGRNEVLIMLAQMTFLADRTELKFEFHKEDQNWGIVSVR